MHYLIIMSACVVTLERTFAHPSPVESLQDLASDKAKSDYIMYAGRIFSTLNTDPRYNEMQEKLKNPESRSRALIDFLGAMSNTTRTKLDKIKAEEAQKYLKKCESQKEGTEPPKPDYIDMQNPEKFSVIDFGNIITKFASMQSLLEKFVG